MVFTLPAVCLCAYLNILLSLAYCFQCSTYRSTGKNIFNPRCNEAFTLIMWTKWTRLIGAAVCHNDCSKNDNIVQRNIARIFNWNIAFRDRDLVWMTSPPFCLCSSQRTEHQGGVVHGLVRHHRCPLDVWWWIHSGVIWAPVRHLHGTVQHCQWVCMAERMEVNLPQILFSWLLLDVFFGKFWRFYQAGWTLIHISDLSFFLVISVDLFWFTLFKNRAGNCHFPNRYNRFRLDSIQYWFN